MRSSSLLERPSIASVSVHHQIDNGVFQPADRQIHAGHAGDCALNLQTPAVVGRGNGASVCPDSPAALIATAIGCSDRHARRLPAAVGKQRAAVLRLFRAREIWRHVRVLRLNQSGASPIITASRLLKSPVAGQLRMALLLGCTSACPQPFAFGPVENHVRQPRPGNWAGKAVNGAAACQLQLLGLKGRIAYCHEYVPPEAA